MSVWVMPSVIDVYENFLKRSQAVAGGGHPHNLILRMVSLHKQQHWLIVATCYVAPTTTWKGLPRHLQVDETHTMFVAKVAPSLPRSCWSHHSPIDQRHLGH